jgi:transposase InsO family protein
MSRRGNCWDNAVQERFYRSLKSESLKYLTRKNHLEAVQQTQKYINFYNYKRRHSAIGYLTPHQKGNLTNNVA